jgi:hypothetical protein
LEEEEEEEEEEVKKTEKNLWVGKYQLQCYL